MDQDLLVGNNSIHRAHIREREVDKFATPFSRKPHNCYKMQFSLTDLNMALRASSKGGEPYIDIRYSRVSRALTGQMKNVQTTR